MAMEFQVLEKVKARISSIKANWGFPAATPILDRIAQATSQVRARIKSLAAGLPGAAAPAPGATATQTTYQVAPEEKKPRVR